MVDSKKFSKKEIVEMMEFDVKQYQRKYESHLSIAEGYLERVKRVQQKISKIQQEMEEY